MLANPTEKTRLEGWSRRVTLIGAGGSGGGERRSGAVQLGRSGMTYIRWSRRPGERFNAPWKKIKKSAPTRAANQPIELPRFTEMQPRVGGRPPGPACRVRPT